MSEPINTAPAVPAEMSTDDMQFTTAEPAAVRDATGVASGTSRACAGCRRPIDSTYFALADQVICPACREQFDAPAKGNRFTRLAKATLFGLGAGLVGALIWFAIRKLTQLEIGLVAILVGYMVGKAVRIGSNHRGGVGYQILAVVLTYSCIAANYMPDIIQALLHREEQQTASVDSTPAKKSAKPANSGQSTAAKADSAQPVNTRTPHEPLSAGRAVVAVAVLVAVVFALSLAAPFFGGAQNLIGLLIIGFALWEAWKLNAHRKLPITGPYQLGSTPSPVPGAAV
jgi:hypothetical protein